MRRDTWRLGRNRRLIDREEGRGTEGLGAGLKEQRLLGCRGSLQHGGERGRTVNVRRKRDWEWREGGSTPKKNSWRGDDGSAARGWVEAPVGGMKSLLAATVWWSLQQMQKGVQGGGRQRSHREMGVAHAGGYVLQQEIALGRNYARMMSAT